MLMPDASGPGAGRRSLDLNSFDGRLRMEDFVAGDVLDSAGRPPRTRTAVVRRIGIARFCSEFGRVAAPGARARTAPAGVAGRVRVRTARAVLPANALATGSN